MTAKNFRLVAAAIVSAYGILSSVDHLNGLHLPVALAAILTSAAPVMLALQHYLSDPTTGTGPQPSSSPAPAPPPAPAAPAAVAPVVQLPNTTTTGSAVSITPTPSPSPAPAPSPAPMPASWSTMDASPVPQQNPPQAIVAPPSPNPAPPAPGA